MTDPLDPPMWVIRVWRTPVTARGSHYLEPVMRCTRCFHDQLLSGLPAATARYCQPGSA
jgi:hypothetical protein